MSDWIENFVKPGNTVVDVGANVGEMSLRFLDAVGPNGVVHAIEPSPKCCARLAEVVREGPPRFYIHRLALGDSTKITKVFHFRHWTLLETNPEDDRYVHRRYDASQDHTYKDEFFVNYVTLDWFMWRVAGCLAHAIKIDVDGATHSVLRGGMEFLRAYKPFLFVELGSEQPEHGSPSESLALLRSLGYRFRDSARWLEDEYILDDIRYDAARTIDFIAVPEGLHA